MIDSAIVERAADVLMQQATELGSRRKIRFGILLREGNRTPLTVPYEQQFRNIYRISFTRDQIAQARTWAVAAITAGYEPHIIYRGGTYAGFIPREMSNLLQQAKQHESSS